MPCDGVAVARVKVSLPEAGGLLGTPEALEAVASLLRARGYEAEVLGSAVAVNGSVYRYAAGSVAGRGPALAEVRRAFEEVGQVLAQERLADMVARNVSVEDRAWAQGHLVLRVRL